MTTETKFTPGPWYISGKTVYALNGQGFNRFSALVQDAHTGEEELKANARLIAAAPELLEALQKMIKMASSGMVDFNPYDEFVMSTARSALAKARGES